MKPLLCCLFFVVACGEVTLNRADEDLSPRDHPGLTNCLLSVASITDWSRGVRETSQFVMSDFAVLENYTGNAHALDGFRLIEVSTTHGASATVSIADFGPGAYLPTGASIGTLGRAERAFLADARIDPPRGSESLLDVAIYGIPDAEPRAVTVEVVLAWDDVRFFLPLRVAPGGGTGSILKDFDRVCAVSSSY